jgi:uncharacterized protein (TIGR00369 family)
MMHFPVHIPFIESLGFELLRFEAGEAEIGVNVVETQLNSFGVAHGGLCMTLLDVAMSHAARSLNRDQPEGGPGVVTVEMKTTFMRPGEGRLRAVGRVLHASSTLVFTQGDVFNSSGALCAHATGTFKYLRKLPTTDRALRALQRR